MTRTRADLEQLGFEGFVPFADLPTANVPKVHGVYVVLRPSDSPPQFTIASTGKWRDGQDPSVPIAHLEADWIEGEQIVYIGKAAGNASHGLFKRLGQYRRYGAGKSTNHRGGRYVWQLEDSDALLVAWRPTPEQDPAQVETEMIAEFRARTGKLPFANLRH